jgi:hypothetical protein
MPAGKFEKANEPVDVTFRGHFLGLKLRSVGFNG